MDLNALLYKYEMDLARTIESMFGGLALPTARHRSGDWSARAERRKALVDTLCWDDGRGMYFDYDFVRQGGRATRARPRSTRYGRAWPARTRPGGSSKRPCPCSRRAAASLAGTEASRGEVTPERPQRQWDYPFGWPPHQMLAWQGLLRLWLPGGSAAARLSLAAHDHAERGRL